jgi:hypothetical protein
MKTARKNQGGQAAIEFIVVCIAIFFFLLLFLSLSLIFVVSEYIDYATFMAARTYKSGFSSQEYQQRYARDVWNKYMENIQGIVTNTSLTFHDNTDPDAGAQTSGVHSNYTIPLFYLPPVFAKGLKLPSTIDLAAETHLGRDPSFEECESFFNQYNQRYGLGLDGSAILQEMDDNGC